MVKRVAGIGFTIFAVGYVILNFISIIYENNFIVTSLSVCGLLALFFALMTLERRAIVLPSFLVLCAVAISIFDANTSFFAVFWEGSRAMRSLISMLLVLPIVGWVLNQESYVEDTIILLKDRIKNSKVLYFVNSFLTQLISFFLLFGAIAVVYQIVQSFFSKHDSEAWKRFKATSILRGFALSTIWVISIPSFAYSVEVMNAGLIPALIQGFILSLLGLLLSVFYLHIYEKRNKISISKDISETISEVLGGADRKKNLHRNPLEFLFLFLSLLALTLIVNALVPVGLLTIIPIVVVCWAVVYFLVKKKFRHFIAEGKRYIKVGVSSRTQETSLLFAAGLLIAALNSSGLSVTVMEGIYHWTENIPGLNFLWVLPFIVVFLGFFGIGPLTVMVIIAGIVKSIHLPYPPELIVLTMTLGSAISIMFSPVIIPVIFLSSINGQSPIENSIKQNWKFAIGFYLLVELYIQLMIL
ncbi:hypothetical protein DCC39_12145 [Pueribacillus theae]|uniref:Permease n=1 Tax=Pueribacillus theae TaxID=2171751 RepID=A0A2U1JY03_9BACI|nr:hypothetical protein [Pueribacillus theae]PWA10032.1 hypothetical protein DCC39_12145 [Pueribacillus theae]